MPPKIRRPAAGRVRALRGGAPARRGAVRRPAAAEVEVPAGFDQAGFDRGLVVDSSAVPLELWKKGLRIVVVDGNYWEEKVSIAGVVQRLVEPGRNFSLRWTSVGAPVRL